jgi:syntaxin 5
MSCQSVDRTAEFFEVLSTYSPGPSSTSSSALGPGRRPGSGASLASAGSFVRAGPSKAKPSRFSSGASDVSYRVQRTARKLQELTRLVKSSDMFGDQTVRINQLSLSIKGEMTDLKGDLDTLAEMVGAQRVGEAAESQVNRRNSSQQGTVHSQRMVDSLKLQLGETTRTFQSVLQTRASKLREQQDRRAALGYTDSSSAILSRPMTFGSPPPGGRGLRDGGGMGEGTGGSGMRRMGTGVGGGVPGRIGEAASLGRMGGDGYGGGGGGGGRGSRGFNNNHGEEPAATAPLQLSEAQLVDRNLDYLESRADAVQTINQTMGSLNTVFSDLLQLIDIQGSAVERIDDNVTQMQDNLEAGIQELEQSVSGTSNLRLMAKMFGVTVVFLIFFIVFLA